MTMSDQQILSMLFRQQKISEWIQCEFPQGHFLIRVYSIFYFWLMNHMNYSHITNGKSLQAISLFLQGSNRRHASFGIQQCPAAIQNVISNSCHFPHFYLKQANIMRQGEVIIPDFWYSFLGGGNFLFSQSFFLNLVSLQNAMCTSQAHVDSLCSMINYS